MSPEQRSFSVYAQPQVTEHWNIAALAVRGVGLHTVCMKRMRLVLDDQLLERATELAGVKTYSAAVQLALEEYVRRIQARQILELAGSGLWIGDLPEMRKDSKAAGKPKRKP
jgi:Arc/MetJ family transcription regulator